MRRIAGSGERAPWAPSAGTTSLIRARSASVRTRSTAAALFSTCAGRELPASGTTPSPQDRTQAKATWAALAPWLSAMPSASASAAGPPPLQVHPAPRPAGALWCTPRPDLGRRRTSGRRSAPYGCIRVRDTWPTGVGSRGQGDHLMKALVYHGPGQKAWEVVSDPEIIYPTDVIVQMDTTTICGTDLHILKGDVPVVTDGRILGHEGIGTITEVGRAVSKLAAGDRVIISCITSCGSCSYCHRQLPAHCLADEGTSGIGWVLGHFINGTQAEYVRVPFAEGSLHKLPAGVSDEAAFPLSDILPTGFEIGVRNGRVKPGDVVAVIGAGPVGLAAMMTAGLYGASRIIAIDLDDNRVQQAKGFGATDVVNSGGWGWKDEVLAMTDGLGVDVAIEAVGMPATFEMATELVGPGGTVANVGVHGKSVELRLQDLWIKDVAITTGLVSATTTPMLLRLVAQGRLTPEKFVSHRFTFDSILDAYDTFGRAAETKSLKVAITR